MLKHNPIVPQSIIGMQEIISIYLLNEKIGQDEIVKQADQCLYWEKKKVVIRLCISLNNNNECLF